MSPCTSKRTPSLASEDDAERLMGLLCSASLEIDGGCLQCRKTPPVRELDEETVSGPAGMDVV
jgi:hypothetical protein